MTRCASAKRETEPMEKTMTRTTAAFLALLASVAMTSAAQPYKGEITKVDGATGKITLKQGPIKKFDMDAMTMGYSVADTAALKGLKVGDKVTFDADETGGKYVVTKIEKSK